MDVKAIHKIFASLIEAGRKTIDDVPEQDKEAVKYVLEQLN